MILRVGENVEKLELLFTVEGNVKWSNHFRRWFGNFLKNKT